MIAKHKKGSYRFSTLAAIVIAILCAVALTSAKDTTTLDEKKAAANAFADLLIKGQFKEAAQNFDKTMKKALRPKKLAKAWNETTANAGPFEKKLGTRADKYLWSDIIYVTCQFQEGPLDIKVVYDKNKKISGLWLVPVPQKVLDEYAENSESIQVTDPQLTEDNDKALIRKTIADLWKAVDAGDSTVVKSLINPLVYQNHLDQNLSLIGLLQSIKLKYKHQFRLELEKIEDIILCSNSERLAFTKYCGDSGNNGLAVAYYLKKTPKGLQIFGVEDHNKSEIAGKLLSEFRQRYDKYHYPKKHKAKARLFGLRTYLDMYHYVHNKWPQSIEYLATLEKYRTSNGDFSLPKYGGNGRKLRGGPPKLDLKRYQDCKFLTDKKKFTIKGRPAFVYDTNIYEKENYINGKVERGTYVLYFINNGHDKFDVEFVDIDTLKEKGITLTPEKQNVPDTFNSPKTNDDSTKKCNVMVTFPNGISAELLGVCDVSTDSEKWWSPHKYYLAEKPYNTGNSKVIAKKNQKAYEFAFKFIGLKKDRKVRVERFLEDFSGWGNCENQFNRESGKYDCWYNKAFSIDTNLKQCNLSVGVETDEWQTVEEHDGNGTLSSSGSEDIVISKAMLRDGKTYINVTHQIKGHTARFVAIDTNGKIHETSKQTLGGNNFIQVNAEFDLPLDKIKTFKLQRRAIAWSTIRNIPLVPDDWPTLSETVKPAVVYGKSDLAAKLPSGGTLEFIGVCRLSESDKPWYSPDGSSLVDAGETQSDFLAKTGGKAYEFKFRCKTPFNKTRNMAKVRWRFGPKPKFLYGTKGEWVTGVNNFQRSLQFADDVEKVDITLDVSNGPWKTIAVNGTKNRVVDIEINSKKNTVEFKDIKGDGGRVYLKIIHPIQRLGHQVMAYNKYGKIRRPREYRENINGIVDVRFDSLKLADVDRFEFQIQEIDTVHFKNISLKTGLVTKPEISYDKLNVPDTSTHVENAVGKLQIPVGAGKRVSTALQTISDAMSVIEIEMAGKNDVAGLAGFFERINESCDNLQGKNGAEIPDIAQWGQLPTRLIDVLEQLHKIEETAEGCRELAKSNHEYLPKHWQTLKQQYNTLCKYMEPKQQVVVTGQTKNVSNTFKSALLPPDMFKVLDLPAGKVIDIPKVMEDETELRKYVERNCGSSIIFGHDHKQSYLAFINTLKIDRPTIIKNGYKIMLFGSKNAPQEITITTNDQKKYRLRIIKAENEGCQIQYQLIDKKQPKKDTKASPPLISLTDAKNFPCIAQPVSENVKIRSGGGSAYYTCGKIKAGEDVTVVAVEFGWAKIVPPKGSFSWIAKKYIVKNPSNPKAGIVNGEGIRIWVGSPSLAALNSSATQIKLSKKNSDIVELLGDEDNGYLKIAPPSGAFLYVPAKQLKYTGPVEKNTKESGTFSSDQEYSNKNETTDESNSSEVIIVGKLNIPAGESGTVIAENGAAFYGNKILYTPKLYRGRLRNGAAVILMDTIVINNKYNIPIIKVKVQAKSGTVEAGSIAWIQLKTTSFADHFIPVVTQKASDTVNSTTWSDNFESGKKSSAEAAYITQKVVDRYAGIKTFQAIGELTKEIKRPDDNKTDIFKRVLRSIKKKPLKSFYAIKMAKPNRYCIEWNSNYNSSLSKIGYAWSMGEGGHLLRYGKYTKHDKFSRTLISADGLTAQPALFFTPSRNRLTELRERSLQQDEQVDGIDCYVITGKHSTRTYTYWISKKHFLVRQYRQVSGGKVEDLIKQAIKKRANNITPEEIAKIEKQFTESNKNVSGNIHTNTQTYRNIIINEPISEESFKPVDDVQEIREKLKNIAALPAEETQVQSVMGSDGIDMSILKKIAGIWVTKTKLSKNFGDIRRIDIKTDGMIRRFEWKEDENIRQAEIYTDRITSLQKQQMSIATGNSSESSQFAFNLDSGQMTMFDSSATIVFERKKSNVIRNVSGASIPSLYWTDTVTKKIQCWDANEQKGKDLIVDEAGYINDVAIDRDAKKMYWTDSYQRLIRCANLDGSNITNIVSRGLSGPENIYLDCKNKKIYWVDWGTRKVQRANMDGSNVENIVKTKMIAPNGIAIDHDRQKLYWTESHGKKIRQCNLDGSDIKTLPIADLGYPRAIRIDQQQRKIYWTDSNPGRIRRANLDGTGAEDIVTDGASGPNIISIDFVDRKIYWTEFGAGIIRRANLDGSDVEDVITGLGNPRGVRVYREDVISAIKLETGKTGNVAHLENGVTVELASIRKHIGQDRRSWEIDGTKLDGLLYETTGSVLKSQEGYTHYEYAARIKGPSGLSVKWDVPGGSNGSYTGNPTGDNGNRIGDLYVYTVNTKDADESATVRIGVSSREWQTLATHSTGKNEQIYDTRVASAAFGRPYEKDSKTLLPFMKTLKTETPHALRVIAITNTDREISGGVSGSGSNSVHSWTYYFKTPLADIKEFRFQSRRYRYVRFENVSLRPGGKTEPKITIEQHKIDTSKMSSGERRRFLIEEARKKRALKSVMLKKYADKSLHLIEVDTTKDFQDGDSIEITELYGTTDKLKPGHNYLVKGRYNLASSETASLRLYATNGETACDHWGRLNKGNGEFTRIFQYQQDGWLHLSFYPARGGSSFGNLYFNHKGGDVYARQKVKDTSPTKKASSKP